MEQPREKGPPDGRGVSEHNPEDDFDLDIPMEGYEKEASGAFDDNFQDTGYPCYRCNMVIYGTEEIEKHQKEHPPSEPLPRTLQEITIASDALVTIKGRVAPDGSRTGFHIRRQESSTDEGDEHVRRQSWSNNMGAERLVPISSLDPLLDEVDVGGPDGPDGVQKVDNPSLQGTPIRSCPGEVIGRIQWPEHMNKYSKFIRISVRANIGDTCHFLRNAWKLPQANLYLYFIDVEPNDVQDDDVELIEDLHKLSEKISILITTMGQCKSNPTLAHMVHKVKELIGNKPQGLCSIALPSWRLLDRKTMKVFRQISNTNETKETMDGQAVEESLGKAHDFYLMADDDREDVLPDSVLPDIIKFRQRLEDKLMLKGETKLPAAYLLAGGAEKSLDYMMSVLKKKIPVIVIVNSGGLADKLCRLRKAGKLVETTTVDDDGMPQQSLHLVGVPQNTRDEFKVYLEFDLDDLLKRFNYINFYDMKSRLDLEDVLCETFIQARQDEQLARLLRKSHVTVTRMQQLDLGLQQSVIITPGSVTAVGSVGVKHSDKAMRLMLHALMTDCPESVRILLDEGLAYEKDFKQHHLAMLYAKVKDSSHLYKLAKKAGKKIEEGKEFTIADSRLVVHYLLLGCTYPLPCGSRKEPDECPYCRKTQSDVQDALKNVELQQPVSVERDCCMEPSQELFLWAVLMGRGELAELFWEQRPERTSSALIASALLGTLAERDGDGDDYRKMSAFAERFQSAAKGSLETAYKVDESSTHKILSKESQCWGNTCILDLAFDLGNMEVVALRALSAKMDSLWRGGIDEDIGIKKILLCLFCPCFISRVIEMEDAEQERSPEGNQEGTKTVSPTPCCSTAMCLRVKKFYTSPRVKFILAQMSFITFLFLYAFVILFQVTPQQFTPAEIVLCVWVFTLCIEEGRQMLCRGGGLGVWDKVKTYFKNQWNQIDFLSVGIFIIGSILRCIGQKHWDAQNASPDDVTEDMSGVFQGAQVLLSLDFILFLARLLQIFCMHQKLGPMITMVFKMMKDLFTFMVILILACLAYAVTSHAILYPNGQTQFTGEGLFKIPAQAFWSIFGDLAIVETLRDNPGNSSEETCSFNRSVVAQGDLPACPSHLSRYLVPILLGLYVMVANVLLLNLLIAIFGNTYSAVKERALVHWRWQRCVVTKEFKIRPLLPPPFSVLCLLCQPLRDWPSGRRSSRFRSCSLRREGNQDDGSQMLMDNMGERKRETVHTLFAWERKMSDEFIRIRKNQEEDNIVLAINGLSSGQGSMESTLKALERDFTVVRRMEARLDKQEEALQEIMKSLSHIQGSLASQKAHQRRIVM